MSYFFTSESVSPGHPDKVADAISDGILDTIMSANDLGVRCACETLVTTDSVIIAGEHKGTLDSLDVEYMARRIVKNIGYEQEGFNWQTLNVVNVMHEQSPDIALGTDQFGAGDQGLVFGYACNQTQNHMPAPVYWSHEILKAINSVRPQVEWILPDAKSQVTVEYNDDSTVKRIDKVVCSVQHVAEVGTEFVREEIMSLISKVLPKDLIDDKTEFFINPTGRFVLGGPSADTGLTGRKIIVDTYGGFAPHGGGAFSGKDPTKVDRSGAYMARYIAKNLVASNKCDWATVQLSYAIGIDKPMSVYVESDRDSRDLTEWVVKNVDLTPKGIIERFDLFKPIYSSTTNYGHFGKDYLPWERVNLFQA